MPDERFIKEKATVDDAFLWIYRISNSSLNKYANVKIYYILNWHKPTIATYNNKEICVSSNEWEVYSNSGCYLIWGKEDNDKKVIHCLNEYISNYFNNKIEDLKKQIIKYSYLMVSTSSILKDLQDNIESTHKPMQGE